MRMRATGAPMYQLKVTLEGIRPPIWRRFVVPGNIPLRRLHDSLQVVMGWTDSHLHEFRAQGVSYGPPDPAHGRVSENKTTLDRVLRRQGDGLTYEYDFADSWTHNVVLEKVLPPAHEGLYPVVLDGRRACPPEDVGGAPGYANFLQVLQNRRHPQHEEMLEWAGGDFDPDDYDARRANLELHGGWVLPDREP